MRTEIDSLHPRGEHCDKPVPKLIIEGEQPDTVAMSVEHEGKESDWVEVETLTLIQILNAHLRHDVRTYAEYEKRIQAHEKTCVECKPRQ